jgi:NDP-sugar pyrophosphorylase family protein
VRGRTLLEHKFDILGPEFEEIVLIVGYQGAIIKNAFGDSYNGTPIRYVEQQELNGTGGALWLAAPFLRDRFVVMMGDDIYAQADLDACIAAGDWALLVEKTDSMGMGGSMEVNEASLVIGIDEGDHRGKAGIMNTNMMILDTRVFEHPLLPKAPGSSEYGLPHTVLGAAKEAGIPVHAVYASGWIQVTAPEDIARAESLLIEDTVPTV